jgi:hypothetical protein
MKYLYHILRLNIKFKAFNQNEPEHESDVYVAVLRNVGAGLPRPYTRNWKNTESNIYWFCRLPFIKYFSEEKQFWQI